MSAHSSSLGNQKTKARIRTICYLNDYNSRSSKILNKILLEKIGPTVIKKSKNEYRRRSKKQKKFRFLRVFRS